MLYKLIFMEVLWFYLNEAHAKYKFMYQISYSHV